MQIEQENRRRRLKRGGFGLIQTTLLLIVISVYLISVIATEQRQKEVAVVQGMFNKIEALSQATRVVNTTVPHNFVHHIDQNNKGFTFEVVEVEDVEGPDRRIEIDITTLPIKLRARLASKITEWLPDDEPIVETDEETDEVPEETPVEAPDEVSDFIFTELASNIPRKNPALIERAGDKVFANINVLEGEINVGVIEVKIITAESVNAPAEPPAEPPDEDPVTTTLTILSDETPEAEEDEPSLVSALQVEFFTGGTVVIDEITPPDPDPVIAPVLIINSVTLTQRPRPVVEDDDDQPLGQLNIITYDNSGILTIIDREECEGSEECEGRFTTTSLELDSLVVTDRVHIFNAPSLTPTLPKIVSYEDFEAKTVDVKDTTKTDDISCDDPPNPPPCIRFNPD